MKFSLTITGSAAALAAAMEAAARVDGGARMPEPGEVSLGEVIERQLEDEAGNAPLVQTPSTVTGIGTVPPMPSQSEPSGDAPTQDAPTPNTSPDSTTTPDTDAEGLPWDARIHSSSKKKTADGVWAKRRGGPSGAELAAIKAELLGVAPAPAPAPLPVPIPAPVPLPPMPAVSEPVETTPMPLPIPMPTMTVPVAPPVSEPTVAPTPEPVRNAETWDFAKLMGHVGGKIGSVISTEYLVQVCAAVGIGSLTDTAQRPEVIPALVERFKADGVW